MYKTELLLLTGGLLATFSAFASAQDKKPADEIAKRIVAAAPAKPFAEPARPRRLLLFTGTRGYRHGSIPVGITAIRNLGEKTGAFETVQSEDIAVFEPKSLSNFDAVCMLNTTGELFLPRDFDKLPPERKAEAEKLDKRLKQSLLDFVTSGRGLIGIHAATDCFYKWPDYGEMIGGYFDGHPWHEKVTLKVEQPSNPLARMFASDSFIVTDEIYQLREPYSRSSCHVLLSLDTGKTDMSKKGIHRTDGDFAVSWFRTQGRGRVFYCSLGHRDEIYWNPKIVRHYLAGIQYALGDLKVDISAATPAGKQ